MELDFNPYVGGDRIAILPRRLVLIILQSLQRGRHQFTRGSKEASTITLPVSKSRKSSSESTALSDLSNFGGTSIAFAATIAAALDVFTGEE